MKTVDSADDLIFVVPLCIYVPYFWGKDEPVQDRTNTEKFLSAGFDTKTSFREMLS